MLKGWCRVSQELSCVMPGSFPSLRHLGRESCVSWLLGEIRHLAWPPAELRPIRAATQALVGHSVPPFSLQSREDAVSFKEAPLQKFKAESEGKSTTTTVHDTESPGRDTLPILLSLAQQAHHIGRYDMAQFGLHSVCFACVLG